MSLALISLSDLGGLLWRNALCAIPLALLAAAICRWLPCRPSTRHALWCIVLASLLAPPILPDLDVTTHVLSARGPSAAPSTNANVPAPPLPATSPPNKPALPERLAIESRLPSDPTPPSLTLRNSTPEALKFADSGAEEKSHETFSRDEPITKTASGTIEQSSSDNLPTACGDVGIPPTLHPTFPNNVSAASPQVFSNPSPSLRSAVPPEPAVVPVSHLKAEWDKWKAQLLAVRDALIALPPIPLELWLGGSILIVLILAGRMLRFLAILRSAELASNEATRLVRRESNEIGLMFPPAVYFTDRRISPLVWCGRQRTLLLPRGLWNELDELGRRAVVLHELAHLKRRDHWICWADLVIGCVYWWHPIAWWVRRRVRDEADSCCDAWVTALLPSSRSAYARALLATRKYVSESHRAMPVVGLGACAQKTKRFARRLTMVMTERSKPRLSMLGAALAACLATAGWLAAPLLACPPEECETSEKAALKAELKAKEKARAQTIVVAPQRMRAPQGQQPDVSTYEAYRELRDQQPRPHDDDLRGRIDQLERRLDRITEHLEKMIEGRPHSMAPAQGGPDVYVTAPGMARRAAIAGFAAPPALPAPPSPPAQDSPTLRVGRALALSAVMEDSGEVEIRLYRLPEGKREAFTTFMSRQDVPILVSPAPDGINVHATPRQHEIVRGFIDLIHPEGRQAPGARGGAPMGGARISPSEMDRLTKLAREYEAAAAEARASGDLARAQDILKELHMKHQGVHDQLRGLNQRAGELRRKAVELMRKSEALQLKAEEAANETERLQILAQAEDVVAEAEAMEELAEVEDADVEAIQEQIESAQEQVVEAIDELAEAEAEAAEEAAEEAENDDSEEDD